MLPLRELEAILPALPRVTLHGPWSRALGFHLLQGPPPGAPPNSPPQPLWPDGARLNGARFTPKGSFGSIYLASDPITALSEVMAVFSHPHTAPFTLKTHPWTIVTVEGVVCDTLDLTDSQNQAALGTTLQELTGNWAYDQEEHLCGRGSPPPTQILGQAAFNCLIIRGFQYVPAKNVGKGTAIVVFSDRLTPSDVSYLEVYDPHLRLRDRRP